MNFDPFCSQSLADSLKVYHRSHTYTNTLWGELAAHLSTVEEPKGDTPESLPSQCQRAEREKWQSTPVTEATENKDTQRHTRTHIETHWQHVQKLCGVHTERANHDSDWLRFNVLLTGEMIFWRFIDLSPLFAPQQGSVVGCRVTLQ